MVTIRVHCPRCKQQTITLDCMPEYYNPRQLGPYYQERKQGCDCPITAFERDTICFKEAKEIHYAESST